MKSESPKSRWLTRTVIGIGTASFFSDLGHETATAILPMFLMGIGASPAALGIIEGAADAVASFAKLASGLYSDRLRRKKPLAVTGYLLTGLSHGMFAFAASWPQILAGRGLGWFGRGIRGPVRDVIMTEAVPRQHTGKAFGFDRALDTLGAVAGPVAALWLIGFTSYRNIFLLTLIPGIFASLAFAFIVKESSGKIPAIRRTFAMSLRELSPEYRKFLVAVGVFGMGDFAHTLLILRATQIFLQSNVEGGARLAVMLYVVHNIVYAAASYPAGALGDRIGRGPLLVAGYALSGVMCLGFLIPSPGTLLLILLFSIGGIYVAIEDSLERAIAAEMLSPSVRGTGFGVLASMNGVGDLISSSLVGFLWTVASPAAGFLYAAACSFAGALLMRSATRKPASSPV